MALGPLHDSLNDRPKKLGQIIRANALDDLGIDLWRLGLPLHLACHGLEQVPKPVDFSDEKVLEIDLKTGKAVTRASGRKGFRRFAKSSENLLILAGDAVSSLISTPPALATLLLVLGVSVCIKNDVIGNLKCIQERQWRLGSNSCQGPQ